MLEDNRAVQMLRIVRKGELEAVKIFVHGSKKPQEDMKSTGLDHYTVSTLKLELETMKDKHYEVEFSENEILTI